jgi:hypothetical protein
LVAHLQFFQTHNTSQKTAKEPPSQRTTTDQMNGQMAYRQEGRTANTGLAKVAVQCSADTFVVNQSLVLRINICGEDRHLRQARNR